MDRSYRITGSTRRTISFKIKKIVGIETLRYEVKVGIAHFKWEKENEFIYFIQVLKILISHNVVPAIRISNKNFSDDCFNNSEKKLSNC